MLIISHHFCDFSILFLFGEKLVRYFIPLAFFFVIIIELPQVIFLFIAQSLNLTNTIDIVSFQTLIHITIINQFVYSILKRRIRLFLDIFFFLFIFLIIFLFIFLSIKVKINATFINFT